MTITRITIRYPKKKQIVLRPNFKTTDPEKIKSIIKDYYGTKQVFLNFTEE
jgi:hypothetical protein